MQTQESIVVNAQALGKSYEIGNDELDVLKDVTFSIHKARFVVLSGASGSGKTTLLNIIGGLRQADNGKDLR